ncbi:TolC family protein [Aureispira anguillae]|uniref:TolC family protein n=1 Tax=Aureispira anguillae TaxID=2864201 RepID=A0A915VJZ3_9BACT|nr:TolC family protein [Aureispira anguillae]BDS09433.1 TolC family protein [Aureispira anguillae]
MRGIIITMLLLQAWSIVAQNFEPYYQAAAANHPQLKAVFNQYYAIKEQVTQVKLPPPSAALGLFILPVETRLGAQRFKVGVSQMFPAFGALKAQKSLIHQKARVALQEAEIIRNELYFSLRNIWYQTAEVQAMIAVEKESIKLLETMERLALQKIEVGKASLAEVYRLKLKINERKGNLDLLNNKLPALRLAFNLLIKEDALEMPSMGDTIALRTLTYPKDSLVKWIQQQNPKLESLDLKQELALKKMNWQKTKNRPTYGLGLDYVFLTKRTDLDPPQNGQGVLMPMFRISVPIYKDQNQARLKEVAFELLALEDQKEQTSDVLTLELERALAAYQAAKIQVKLYQEQINFSQKTVRLLLTNYSVDNKGFEDLLNVEDLLLKYQKMLLRASIAQNTALIQIEKLFAQPLFN